MGLQRASDNEIVQRARQDGRVIPAFDLDFDEILALGVAHSPSVIIFRLSDKTGESVNRRFGAVLSERNQDPEKGVLILVEDRRYRMRRLPIPGGSF